MTNRQDTLDRRNYQGHQDNRSSLVHRRLNQLRASGFDEVFFSLEIPTQHREFRETVAELDFYHFPYEVVQLEGNVVFLFLSREDAVKIGVATRRNAVNQALDADFGQRDEEL